MKEKILNSIDTPLKFILNGGKMGLNGVKRIGQVFFLFGLTNLIMFGYNIYHLFESFTYMSLLYVLLNVITGIVITFGATYMTYQYAITSIIEQIYDDLSDSLLSMCTYIEYNFMNFLEDHNIKELTKSSINITKIINDNFADKMPNFVKKSFVLILSAIPYVDYLVELEEDIRSNDSSDKLYMKVDSSIRESLKKDSNITIRIVSLLIFNIVISYYLINL